MPPSLNFSRFWNFERGPMISVRNRSIPYTGTFSETKRKLGEEVDRLHGTIGVHNLCGTLGQGVGGFVGLLPKLDGFRADHGALIGDGAAVDLALGFGVGDIVAGDALELIAAPFQADQVG